jgi:hypothetical protein
MGAPVWAALGLIEIELSVVRCMKEVVLLRSKIQKCRSLRYNFNYKKIL